MIYGSAFLQKPSLPANSIAIVEEDLNGLMACIYGMDWDATLTLLLHTPGGSPGAAEAIVSYLREKFGSIEVIVPAFAMSAGAMVCLAADRLIMGRQSQLGPIDPQMLVGGQFISAQAIVDQFERAKAEIKEDPTLVGLWAPVLTNLGPSLLVEAQNAIQYSESTVQGWLEKWMFAKLASPAAAAKNAAKYFNNARVHMAHDTRIDRTMARSQHLEVEDLEERQDLQDAVLTAYHIMTIMFEQTACTKMIRSGSGQSWMKSHP